MISFKFFRKSQFVLDSQVKISDLIISTFETRRVEVFNIDLIEIRFKN